MAIPQVARLVMPVFVALANERGYRFFAHFEPPISTVSVDDLIGKIGGELVRFAQTDWSVCCLYEYPLSLFYDEAYHNEGMWSHRISLAADTRDILQSFVEQLQELLPSIEPDEGDKVPVMFWGTSAAGVPLSKVRYVRAPEWQEIRDNYAGSVRGTLDYLVNLRPPIQGGQLILIYGKPGTGKTFFIRALARAWKEWCRTSYIVEPEALLSRAEFLFDLLLDFPILEKGMGLLLRPDPKPEAPNFDGAYDSTQMWNLLVVEDADELLTVDAKQRAGQAFSRLLNLTEGFIGQGFPVLVLLTTNEPVENLHPAAIRPGRCLVSVELPLLSVEEANSWLIRHGLGNQVNGPVTLAELYAILRGQGKGKAAPLRKGPVGFQPT